MAHIKFEGREFYFNIFAIVNMMITVALAEADNDNSSNKPEMKVVNFIRPSSPVSYRTQTRARRELGSGQTFKRHKLLFIRVSYKIRF